MTSPSSGEGFAAFVEDIVMSGFAALNIAVGSRLRLFDALADASASGPVTSSQLALKTGMKERYLREWLAGMATAKVIDYDSTADGFYLATHKLDVVRTSPAFQGHACLSELLAGLGRTHEHVLACFPESGPAGIPYSVCGGLFEWLGRRQPMKFTRESFESLLSHMPELVDQLTHGIDVADFGCGSGGAINVLARMFPASSFVGLDITEGGLHDARVACRDLSNVQFRQVDVCNITDDLHSRFDLVIVYDVLHDLPFPEKLLDAITKALRSRGRLLLNEVDAHSDLKDNLDSKMCTAFYCISLHHCLPTSLNTQGSRGLGTCGGLEVYQHMIQSSNLVNVQRIQPKEGGLFFYAEKP